MYISISKGYKNRLKHLTIKYHTCIDESTGLAYSDRKPQTKCATRQKDSIALTTPLKHSVYTVGADV